MMAINANEVFVSFIHNHILSANESLVDKKRGKYLCSCVSNMYLHKHISFTEVR